jgi:hypothetical protein
MPARTVKNSQLGGLLGEAKRAEGSPAPAPAAAHQGNQWRQLNTNIDEELYQRLRRYSFESGLRMQHIIGRALEEHLERNA